MIRTAMFAALTSITALSTASAADLRLPAPIYKAPIAYAYDWSGFYAGVQGGWSSGTEHIDSAPTLALFPTTGIKGWEYGFHTGVNKQVGNWVFGLRTEWNKTTQNGFESTFTCLCYDIHGKCLENQTDSHSVKLDWYGSTQSRVGYAIDRLHVGVMAGIAYGAATIQDRQTYANKWYSWDWVNTTKHRLVGGTVGAFGEYAITRNVIVSLEVAYRDLRGIDNVSTNGTYASTLQTRLTDTSVKGGLTWKF